MASWRTSGGRRSGSRAARSELRGLITRLRRDVSELPLTVVEDDVPSDRVVSFDNLHTLPRVELVERYDLPSPAELVTHFGGVYYALPAPWPNPVATGSRVSTTPARRRRRGQPRTRSHRAASSLATERDARAARRFFTRAIVSTQSEPAEVVTDRARAYLGALDEMLPGALHDAEQYANNVLEADHGWLKSRLRPMRG